MTTTEPPIEAAPAADGPRDQLLAAAREIGPELRARSREIDTARQLPQDIAEKLAERHFYRTLIPEELGGLGLSPRTLCELCETLAAANGSAAWCVFIGATSKYLFGALHPSLLEEMKAIPNLITAGVFAESGTARFEERDGRSGYVVDGHWRWASGCHNAHWISGGVREVDASGEPVAREAPLSRAFFLPQEVEILDNWHTSGMRGTGSSDFKAQNVWLPEERMTTTIDHTPYAEHQLYRFPRFGILGIPIGAIALGMARDTLREVLEQAQQKTPMGSRRTLALRPALHIDVAKADTELRAARSWFYRTIDEAWDHAQHAPETLTHRRLLRTATVHATNTAVRVIDTMYTHMGGTSVFEDSCLQRHFRDVHVATQHMMVGEPVMELAGRVMLGLDDKAFGL